ncbi:MAG TPA: ABC transporter permease subunit [Saprospiraceae bacterium]|nr:ABC transporter permease subunit [Saprospiraceae bacterium]
MKTIYLKEISHFFSTISGYMVIAFFILVSGLFMWIFRDTAIIYTPFASLDPFFQLAPFLLLFLVPAITMKIFSDEYQQGTMELLLTRPVNTESIILGKFLASATLVVLAILPTLLYYISICFLSDPKGNVDHGAIIGSYIGLMFLAMAFTAMGIFASALTTQQVGAFLLGVIICFFLYWGFHYISNLPFFDVRMEYVVQKWGIMHHYENMNRGSIDSKGIVYFGLLTWFFHRLTFMVLEIKGNR